METLELNAFYSYDMDASLVGLYEFRCRALGAKFTTNWSWTTSADFKTTDVTDFPIVDSEEDAHLVFRNYYYLRFLVEKDSRLYYISYTLPGELMISIAADEIIGLAEIQVIKDEWFERFPKQVAVDNRVPVKFWANSANGPNARTSSLEVPSWDEISGNYSKTIEPQIAELMAKRDHAMSDGQMLLWYGPPGTGKTYALRALISEWRDWANFEYIVDPESFFGPNANYLFEVIHNNEGNKWKVLILEDCGEMLSLDAKARMGQGFQRLLNVVDGLIGQGLKLMVFVSTNEQLDKLHPAVSRAGRCFAKIEFPALTPDEVAEWLTAHGIDHADSSQSLSELYGKVGGNSQISAKKSKIVGFG